ncbi:ATP-dependent Clp protease ATP-binding subunit ClpX, partial [Nocardiopsis tropica]
EEVLLSVMYEVPSREDVGQVIISRETVIDNVNPTIVPRIRTEQNRRRRDRSA